MTSLYTMQAVHACHTEQVVSNTDLNAAEHNLCLITQVFMLHRASRCTENDVYCTDLKCCTATMC